jgi:hypothetical protein
MNGQPSPFLIRPYLFALIFFAIFIFLFSPMSRFLVPFSSALLWVAVISLAFTPLYRSMVLIFKGGTRLVAT